MFLQAVLAFLALPGMIAIAIPATWLFATSGTQVVYPPGLAVLALGFAALLACVRDFHVAGKGTLAPWAPPQRLVEVGLYRYTRNPMYVAVVTMLAGWAIAFGSVALAAYAFTVAAGFHLRVVRQEEPFLARTHGRAWADYSDRVPRWLPGRMSGRMSGRTPGGRH